ncbi:MAG: hypothetical protein A3E01_07915 [Gammaproteobacteria bacterium RIFCSPHIGHO2_12_FULL_63_22]|nr:MAG: hypothetical protein A3E01_07915 [Gammaproteobacteria bacterium RIFCSPHIGHO2_12_FULL_63_22]
MARNVRNFWLTAQADGGSQVAVGPKSKDGGLRATLYLRESGQISDEKVMFDAHHGIGADLVTLIELPPSAEVIENADGSKTVRIRKTR